MEATALSVGKSVLDGALGYAKSALAEEVALQLGIQRDHAFVRDELAMMQAFLRAAHDERDNHEVLMTWVKQVRDVAYDAEDCLQEFGIHPHKPSWWRLPRTLRERRRIAKQMKDLRTRVEDVSQRNLRYQLIKSAGFKSATTLAEQSNITDAVIFGIDEARRAEKHENSKVDLVHLINTEDENLRVISVWGTSGDLGQASIINEAYENPYIKKKFSCRGWVRVLHPFSLNHFIQSLVNQFRSGVEIGILLEAEKKTGQELADEFMGYINRKSYLVVLNGVSTFEEWKWIRTCFPENKTGSRIIVCTPQAEVASLCAGQESQVLELKQLSTDQTIYAFCETDKPKEDLLCLINMEDKDLRVIVVETKSNLEQASVVKDAYDKNPGIKRKFSCRAWVKVLHPFSPQEFKQCVVKQFRSAIGSDMMLKTEKTEIGLVEEFNRFVKENSYLIVLNDLSTIEEWNDIKAIFQNNKNGSRIIVCAPQVKVARVFSGLKQFSTSKMIYAFCMKDYEEETNSPVPILPRSDTATSDINSAVPNIEIQENRSKCCDKSKVVTKGLTRIKTMTDALEESQLIGRRKEIDDIIKLISNELGQQFLVISVWGMGGLGKTTLVKDVYQNQNHFGRFEKRAFVTVMRPFNLKNLLKSLIVQLSTDPSKTEGASLDYSCGTRKKLAMMEVEELSKELALVLGNKCLVVLDDLSSTTEWDMIIQRFPKMENASHRIIVTTREENIAKHCSNKQENIYFLNFLDYKDALNLFTRKVFGNIIKLDEQYPELVKEANLILKKCNGLPLAIVTIGGFLAKQQKTPMEWRKLNEHISAELEMNPELGLIKNILNKSYDGIPYHLKSCFLYMSVFPEDYNISRRRLVQRWTAEGYSSEVHGKSQEEIADSYFVDLIDRSMILPFRKSIGSGKGINSCRIHDLMREISISKSVDENLVFRLEEDCSSDTHDKVRHVAISSNWEGDKSGFESAVDLSHIRSLTVFAKWKPFFISKKMRLLRVLDLEGTSGLVDHHLEHIGRLLHLKYVSLRGCEDIYHLPDSLGNLRQLQTLDIKGTSICKLPKSITKLTKLQYIFGGDRGTFCFNENERLPDDLVKLCGACCAPKLLKDAERMSGDPNMHDVCSFWCHVAFPTLTSRRVDPYGFVVPRGIKKLKSLRTLGVLNIARGKAILRDIRRLTQLRKLAVKGINEENCKELCSTIADLIHLESLSVESSFGSSLHGYMDGLSIPPRNLQSLKLTCTLVELPEWTGGLESLVKLVLRNTRLTEVDSTMRVLGKLPNLVILGLRWRSFKDDVKRLTFHSGMFPSLMVLQLSQIYGLRSVEFVAEATPKLEVLVFFAFSGSDANAQLFSGLVYLGSLKEFILDNSNYYGDGFTEDVQQQLAGNQNGPVLRRCNWREFW